MERHLLAPSARAGGVARRRVPRAAGPADRLCLLSGRRPDLDVCRRHARHARIEIATVGSDGMTGPGVLLGDMTAGETLVQAAGSAWRIAAGSSQRLAELHPALHRNLLAHVGVAFADHWTPSAAAAVRRSSSGWRTVLQAAQRLDARRLVITHDALAEILGVRRPSARRACRCWKAGT